MSVKRMLATLKSLFGIGLIAPVALSAFGGFSMLAVNEGGKKDRRQAPAVEEPAAEEPAASPAPAAKGMKRRPFRRVRRSPARSRRTGMSKCSAR